MKYQFYGDTEFIASELPYILKSLMGSRVKGGVQARRKQFGNSARTSDSLKECNKTVLQQVAELYKIDYEIFGFQYPDPNTLEN